MNGDTATPPIVIAVLTPEQRVLQQAAQRVEEDTAVADEKELDRERRRLSAAIVNRNVRFTRAPPIADDEQHATFRRRQLAVLFVSNSGIVAAVAKAIAASSHGRHITANAAAVNSSDSTADDVVAHGTTSRLTAAIPPQIVTFIMQTFALNIDSAVSALSSYTSRDVDFVCAMTELTPLSSQQLPVHRHMINASFIEQYDNNRNALITTDEFQRIKEFVDGLPDLFAALA